MFQFMPHLIAALLQGASPVALLAPAPEMAEPAPIAAPQETPTTPGPSEKSPPRQVSPPEKVELAPTVLPDIESEPATPVDTAPGQRAPAGEILPPVTPPVEAAPQPASETTPLMSQEDILINVRRALSDVTSARGKFEQLNPNGSLVTGDYALRRPGRVRFEYDDPVPLLIVSDGTNISQVDTEFQETETIPLGTTPLKAILGSGTDFDDSVTVAAVNQGNGFASVTVVDPSQEFDGSLTLVFDMSGWSLEQWTTVDAIGATTTVRLLSTETGVKLDPRLFRVEDERDDRDRDRR